MSPRAVRHLLPSRAWGGAEQVADTLRALGASHGWASTLDLPALPGARWSPGAHRTESWAAWALRPRPAVTVVHAHLPWPDRLGAALLAARGLPLVVTFHLLPPPAPWPRDRLFALPSRAVLGLAGRLHPRVRWVALSRDDVATLGPLLGVPVHRVRNAPPVPSPAGRALAWPTGTVRLVSVGRLEWQKGYDQLLEALAHPSLRQTPWHWTLVGDGVDRDALAQRACALGFGSRVTFAGNFPATDALRGADLVVAPSRREGMPLVPLEAAEAGVAVLASPIAPHRELYEAVPAALLPENLARWPEALGTMLRDPGARASLALAQGCVLGNNPRAALWSAYEALYADLARG